MLMLLPVDIKFVYSVFQNVEPISSFLVLIPLHCPEAKCWMPEQWFLTIVGCWPTDQPLSWRARPLRSSKTGVGLLQHPFKGTGRWGRHCPNAIFSHITFDIFLYRRRRFSSNVLTGGCRDLP